MNSIQLLTVENSLDRDGEANRQTVAFLISVENVGYIKEVDVLWGGKDGATHTLHARYSGPHGSGREFWRAQLTVHEKAGHPIGEAIRFSLRLRWGQREVWDNNSGRDYYTELGSGVITTEHVGLQNLNVDSRLHDNQRVVPVRIAMSPSIHAQKVYVHWSTDNWLLSEQTPCEREQS
jgi:maltose 6'-phosphate phosphatase